VLTHSVWVSITAPCSVSRVDTQCLSVRHCDLLSVTCWHTVSECPSLRPAQCHVSKLSWQRHCLWLVKQLSWTLTHCTHVQGTLKWRNAAERKQKDRAKRSVCLSCLPHSLTPFTVCRSVLTLGHHSIRQPPTATACPFVCPFCSNMQLSDKVWNVHCWADIRLAALRRFMDRLGVGIQWGYSLDSLHSQDTVRIVRTNDSLDTDGTVRMGYIMVGQDRLRYS